VLYLVECRWRHWGFLQREEAPLGFEGGVGNEHEFNIPLDPVGVTNLVVTEAQQLLSVSMEGFYGPATGIVSGVQGCTGWLWC
jgi:hypothetical protein